MFVLWFRSADVQMCSRVNHSGEASATVATTQGLSAYFVTCLHQNSLMMLHQLGIQQAERETPAEAHISCLANTSMRTCTLFYIETRQTLPVQVETKMPDVVVAFSVHYRITIWSLKSIISSLRFYPKTKTSVWFWCLVGAYNPWVDTNDLLNCRVPCWYRKFSDHCVPRENCDPQRQSC